MKFLSEKNFARASALVSVLVLGALGPNMLYSSTPSEESTSRVFIQGSDVDSLVLLVESAGGTVSQKLDAVKAVDVQLTFEQLTVVSESDVVHRIILDHQASVDTSIMESERNSGRWWQYTVDVAPTLAGTRNHGRWWQ
jgi:hypothetical protein